MPNIISIDSMEEAQLLIGNGDEHILMIEEAFNVDIHTLGSEITVAGEDDDIDRAETVLINLLKIIQKGMSISKQDVQSAIEMMNKGTIDYLADLYLSLIHI